MLTTPKTSPLHPLAARFLAARSAVDRRPYDPAVVAALAEARASLRHAFDRFGAPKFIVHDGHRFSAPCGQLEVTKMRERPITSARAGTFGRAAWEVKKDASRGGSD